MVWVEQPVGTGFTQGNATATSQEETAEEFLGFFKNFVDTFGLQNRKVYITGESYAGRYVPYIADAMLSKNDSTYYDVKGIMFYDPSVAEDVLLEDIPAVAFVDKWAGLFNFNQTFMDDIHNRSEACGYTEYMEKYLTFPPPSKLPYPDMDANTEGCGLWEDIYNAVFYTNPCFDVYAIATTCPLLWDVLGFPGSFDYLPPNTEIYFNRTDVQKAINAPPTDWNQCVNGVFRNPATNKTVSDQSIGPAQNDVLKRVIEYTNNTLIGSGNLDMLLSTNGTLLAIQNVTVSTLFSPPSKPNH